MEWKCVSITVHITPNTKPVWVRFVVQAPSECNSTARLLSASNLSYVVVPLAYYFSSMIDFHINTAATLVSAFDRKRIIFNLV